MSTGSGGLDRRLEALGLQRAGAPPRETDVARLDRRTAKLVTTRPAMGTHVTVTALGGSPERLEEAVGRALAEMDRLIALLTRFDAASPVAVLNATGRLDAPPPEVAAVVAGALDMHRLSGGAFDPTVAPLLALFESRLDRPDPAAPSDGEVRDALERVGAAYVAASPQRIGFARPGMSVTLDGIAKGSIVDAVAAELERHGVTRYLVDAGGDIRAGGTKEGGAPWTVAVRDPAGSPRFPDLIHLAGGAVATSGSYENFFDPSRAFHHIVDPASGRSPGHAVSASVRAPTAQLADALATSVFVLAPAKALALVDRLRSCACLIIDAGGKLQASRAWKSALPPHPPDKADA